jgi:hypothetical protein
MGLVAGVWTALAPLPAVARELVYVIPQGSWTRRIAGEKLSVLPSHVRLTVGLQDVLVLKNEDDMPHLFGPVLLQPEQTYRVPVRVPSRFQYACTLHASGQLTITIEPIPEIGWARLRWRLSRIVDL